MRLVFKRSNQSRHRVIVNVLHVEGRKFCCDARDMHAVLSDVVFLMTSCSKWSNESSYWAFNAVIITVICGNKVPTTYNRWIFIADLIACSTCFGHHYAHHQELESITQVVAACRIWCLVFKLSVWYGAEGCVGIMVPETFWASNKICNKNSSVASSWHFFPHIIDDARSKPHQTKSLIQNNLCPSWGFELL